LPIHIHSSLGQCVSTCNLKARQPHAYLASPGHSVRSSALLGFCLFVGLGCRAGELEFTRDDPTSETQPPQLAPGTLTRPKWFVRRRILDKTCGSTSTARLMRNSDSSGRSHAAFVAPLRPRLRPQIPLAVLRKNPGTKPCRMGCRPIFNPISSATYSAYAAPLPHPHLLRFPFLMRLDLCNLGRGSSAGSQWRRSVHFLLLHAVTSSSALSLGRLCVRRSLLTIQYQKKKIHDKKGHTRHICDTICLAIP